MCPPQVVFACGAESSLKLLGHGATFFERRVLGSVRYYDDVTYTHTDNKRRQRRLRVRRVAREVLCVHLPLLVFRSRRCSGQSASLPLPLTLSEVVTANAQALFQGVEQARAQRARSLRLLLFACF